MKSHRTPHVVFKTLLAILWLLAVMASFSAAAAEFLPLHTPEATVHYRRGLEGAARETAHMLPALKRELEIRFGWPFDFKPRIVLVNDRRLFLRKAGSELILAYAAPAEQLIVMDYSRSALRSRRLRSVLKHELAHLLLHAHLAADRLPRWLDEGLAQWVSDGVGEMLLEPAASLLENAAVSGRTIPLQQLEYGFPEDRRRLQLSYEISRSFVLYLVERYGEDRILDILNRLRTGDTVEQAFEASLSATVAEIEAEWLSAFQSPTGWLSYLAAHIYVFLFVAGALLTVYGFVRFVIRKRNYKDEDEDD